MARGEAAERGDFLPRHLRSPAAPQSQSHAGAARRARQRLAACRVQDHQGRDARSRQLDAWKSPTCSKGLPPGQPLHFARRVQFRRPARPAPTTATSTTATGTAWASWHAARSARRARAWAWSTSGWASTSNLEFSRPTRHLDLPDRNASANPKAASSWSTNRSSSSRTGSCKATPTAAGA